MAEKLIDLARKLIPVVRAAGAMAQLGLEPHLLDYVPCYRSEAGTGNAMGFVYWQ